MFWLIKTYMDMGYIKLKTTINKTEIPGKT